MTEPLVFGQPITAPTSWELVPTALQRALIRAASRTLLPLGQKRQPTWLVPGHHGPPRLESALSRERSGAGQQVSNRKGIGYRGPWAPISRTRRRRRFSQCCSWLPCLCPARGIFGGAACDRRDQKLFGCSWPSSWKRSSIQVGGARHRNSSRSDSWTRVCRLGGFELGLHRALCRCRSSSCFQRSSHPAVQGRGRDGQTIQEVCLRASKRVDQLGDASGHCSGVPHGGRVYGRCGRRRRAAGGCPSSCFHTGSGVGGTSSQGERAGGFNQGQAGTTTGASMWSDCQAGRQSSSFDSKPPDRSAGSRRLGSTSTACRASASSRGSRDSTTCTNSCKPSSRRHDAHAGARSRSRSSSRGSNQCSDWARRGSDPAIAFCTASSEPSALGETHCTKACRSAGQHAGRLGQRKRQWRRIRSPRMHCSGHLRPNDAGCEQAGRDLRAERSQGARFSSRTSGQFIDAEVCGEETSCFRKQTDDIPGIPDGRRMGFGTWQQQPRVDGCRWESFDVSGTGVIRPRTSSISLAFDGSSRPSLQHPAVEQEEDRTFSIQQTGSGAVDCGESGSCQGHRHAGKQDLGDEKGHEAKCRRRRGCRAEAKKTTKEPKSKVEVKGCRGEHFDQLGVGDGYETASAMSGSLESFEAVSWAGTARASPYIDPGDLPSSGPCDKPYPAADMSFRNPSSLPDFHNSNEVFNPIELAEMMCKQFWKCRTSLTAFAHRSIHPSCTVENYPSDSLWPVPIPRWSWTAASRLGPRRRKRRRFFRVRHHLLQIAVISFNWEVLGFKSEPPAQATTVGCFSQAQLDVIQRLEDMLTHFLMMGSFGAEDLGRPAEKFKSVIRTLTEELPDCEARLQDLEEFCLQLHGSLNPYSSHFGNPDWCSQADDPNLSSVDEHSEVTGATQVSGAKPIQSARIKWENPPSFHPEEFLNPIVRSAYEDPEVLRLPKELWPRSKPARMHITRSEFLKLVERWDALGACSLMCRDDKDMEEAVGIFGVPKDLKFDRLIINPKTINSRMFSISDSTKDLSPGSMLTLLHLPEGTSYRFCADDLTDFYYTFCVSTSRATRNAFRMPFDASELEHLQCFDPSLAGKQVLVCLRTLAMGDSLAVEIAQQSHGNVLKKLAGALRKDEFLRYRKPIPRSDFVELLAIDDHVGIQRLPTADLELTPELRDSEVFKRAQDAYLQVGLIQQEKKRKRYQTQGTILGADFDGVAGKVMAPRNRIAILSAITLEISRKGSCTPKLLSIVLGCWIHILLFRRIFFAIIDQLFKEGRGLKPNAIFRLSAKSRCELQLLAALSPFVQSDLRVKYSDKIYCTDASPSGGAVISAHIGQTASEEIWRHTEQRGYYSRLQSPASEILSEKGLDPESMMHHVSRDPLPEASNFSIPCPLSEGIVFDCLEIFRGSGNWSSVHQSKGLIVHAGIENSGRTLRVADMSDPGIFRELIALALRRIVLDWHCGVPCLTFGTLRRPQLRSKEFPAGFDMDDPLTAYHNMLARRAAFIITVALLMGAFVSVEQPGSSRLFLLHCYRGLIQLGCVISHFAFCNFGSAFNKPSKWLHNKPWLIPLEGSCRCPFRKNHFVVQGCFTKENIEVFKSRCRPNCQAVYGHQPIVGELVSAYSAAYPLQLVTPMAIGLLEAKKGRIPSMPREKHLESLAEVGLSDSSFVDIPVETEASVRAWHEDPEWIAELCDSLPFREVFRFKFKRPGHININETRTFKSLIKSLAKSSPSIRFPALLDSRVTIGAAAKGRSSSPGITRILQGCLAYAVGSALYPGLLHCSSGANRSDGPSRGRPIAPPTKELPSWFDDLRRGDYARFDVVIASSRCEKLAARWLRFLLLLAGDIEENPGPRARGGAAGDASGLHARGPMDLNVGFVKATSDRMQRCFAGFKEWCISCAEMDWDALSNDPKGLAWALRAFGLYLFEAGHPRYLFVYSITACQEYHPASRTFMSVAWQIDKKWQIHEPGTSRSVLPALIIRAALCLGGLWSWWNWAALVALGFGAMLHPAEMLALQRKDLIFPADVCYDSQSLYVRIRDPKTARFARRQHGRIDDESIIALSFAVFGRLPLEARLYPASLTSFRKQWDLVMTRLGVPCRQATNGATPGVLRGSGATYLYSATEDINWVAWRGRWSRVRTLEYYLQEVASYLLIHQLHPLAKARIAAFSEASSAVIWSRVLAAQH